MSTPEQINGAEARVSSVAGQDVRALRCGRSEPPMHLVEADDSLTRPNWRVGPQEHVALCNAQLSESTPVPDFEDCPGCVDCTRYCGRCVRVAAEYSAGDQPDLSAPEDGDDDRPMGWVLVGECPHPVVGGPAFHVGPCRKCDAAQRRRRRKDRQVPGPGPGQAR